MFNQTMKLSSDLVQNWLTENGRDAILGVNHNELSVAGTVCYQPSDGLKDLKLVINFICLLSVIDVLNHLGLHLSV